MSTDRSLANKSSREPQIKLYLEFQVMFPNIQLGVAGGHDFLQTEAESTDLDTFAVCWRKLYLDMSNKPMDREDQLNQLWFLMVLMVLDSVLTIVSTWGWNLWASLTQGQLLTVHILYRFFSVTLLVLMSRPLVSVPRVATTRITVDGALRWLWKYSLSLPANEILHINKSHCISVVTRMRDLWWKPIQKQSSWSGSFTRDKTEF